MLNEINHFHHERCAVVIVDVVESVRHMRSQPTVFVLHWHGLVSEVREKIARRYGGRLIKSLGDGLLLTFDSARGAALAALEIRAAAARRNDGLDATRSVYLRTGISIAEVLMDDLDVYGDGVNMAARLAALGGPGDIIVSDSVCDEVETGIDVLLEDMGLCVLKHYPDPVRAFRIRSLEETALHSPHGADMRPGVAVLPFEPSGRTSDSLSLSMAISDDIIAALSKRPDLRVISSLSMAAVFRTGQTLGASVATRLKAGYLISGSLHLDGPRADVRINLTATEDGEVLWADSKGIQVIDLFRGTDPLVPLVAAEVGRNIVQAEITRARRLPISSLERYTLFTVAKVLLHKLRHSDFMHSRLLLERLVELEPRSPEPHAMLAKWHMMNGAQGWCSNARDTEIRTVHHLHRALDNEPEHAFALALSAHLEASHNKNLLAAVETAGRAIASNPQEPSAWMFMAGALDYIGRGEEAVLHAQRAIDLSPLDPSRFLFDVFHAAALTTAGRFTESVVAAESSIRANARHPASRRVHAIALALSNRSAEAIAAGRQLLALDPGFSVSGYRARAANGGTPHFELEAQGLRAAGLPE